jgi:hypothetical protein
MDSFLKIVLYKLLVKGLNLAYPGVYNGSDFSLYYTGYNLTSYCIIQWHDLTYLCVIQLITMACTVNPILYS